MAREITADDLRMIRYFWKEKGDPTRWVEWNDKLPALLREHHEVIAAWNSYLSATRTFTAVLDAAVVSASEEGP